LKRHSFETNLRPNINNFKREFGKDITSKFQFSQDKHKSLFNKSSGKGRTFINELHVNNEAKSMISDNIHEQKSEQSALQEDFEIFNFACDTCPRFGAACTCLTTP